MKDLLNIVRDLSLVLVGALLMVITLYSTGRCIQLDSPLVKGIGCYWMEGSWKKLW